MPSVVNTNYDLIDLGVLDYEAAYRLQKVLVEKRKCDATRDTILLVEHPDVYTVGRAYHGSIPVPAVVIERGGEITFHNRGQLVCYPILKLCGKERDVHLYLRTLEKVIVDTLADFAIAAQAMPNATGVWIKGKNKKIASIGVAISSWVTYHGIALNVSNDLSGFQKIRPCGYGAEVMTSMAEQLGNSGRFDGIPEMKAIKSVWLRHFSIHFSRTLVKHTLWRRNLNTLHLESPLENPRHQSNLR